MDRCLDTAAPNGGAVPPLTLSIALNVGCCGVALLVTAGVGLSRRGAPTKASKRTSYGCPAGPAAAIPAVMLLLSAPPVVLFSAARALGKMELACELSTIGLFGLPIASLLLGGILLLMLLFDQARLHCTRHTFAATVVQRLRESSVGFAPELTVPFNVLSLPAQRGVFLPPLVAQLGRKPAASAPSISDGDGLLFVPPPPPPPPSSSRRPKSGGGANGLSAGSDESDGGSGLPRIMVYGADAWGTRYRPESDAWLRHNMVVEDLGGGTACCVPIFTDYSTLGLETSSVDLVFIPLSRALPWVAGGSDSQARRDAKTATLLRECLRVLRPGGAIASASLMAFASSVTEWEAALTAAGFTGVDTATPWLWLAFLPSRLTLAFKPSVASALPDVSGGSPYGPRRSRAASSRHRQLSSGSAGSLRIGLTRPAPLFPPGLKWRARDAVVVTTTALWLGAVFTVFTADYQLLLIPSFVSWASTLGSLALSSLLLGPFFLWYLAVDLSTFADGRAEPGAYLHRVGLAGHHSPLLHEGGGASSPSPSGGSPLGHTRHPSPSHYASYAHHESASFSGGGMSLSHRSADGLGFTPHRHVRARDVLRRWALVELPQILCLLTLFQLLAWTPGFVADATLIHYAGWSSASASLAAILITAGLLFIGIPLGRHGFGVWLERRRRAAEDAEEEEDAAVEAEEEGEQHVELGGEAAAGGGGDGSGSGRR